MPQLCCVSLATGLPVPIPAQTLLCLGNFDGVHLAHRALIRTALQARDRLAPGASVGVFCFYGLSSDLLSAEPPGHLCTNAERMERFAACGAELAILADFAELRELDAQDYLQDVLIRECHAVSVACGYNHRYGKDGKGELALLRKTFGDRLLLQEPILYRGEPVSSSRIRMLLSQGSVEDAAALLSQPYTLTAPVCHGKALGRRIGSPTVNQYFPTQAQLPRFGVYLTDCCVDGVHYFALSNVGVRPTVEGEGMANCESYLLDFSGELYGKTVTVSFLKFLRPEIKFSSVEELQQQIQKDISAARAICDQDKE